MMPCTNNDNTIHCSTTTNIPNGILLPKKCVDNNVSLLLPKQSGKQLTQIVHTKLGPCQGFRHELRSGQWADIFLGIPFAKPPIGALRFERPEPVASWHDLLQALQFGPGAISLDYHSTCPQSEDCLHLNIFRPSLPSPTSSQSEKTVAPAPFPPLLPIFFYIHGGGFCSGSTNEYGYEGWTENFIPQDVMVVTVQYRLGPFGFFSFGDRTTLPGNLGYWDLAMALRFVHENIAEFGGDPKRITVVGLSAGGAAASAMALSPITRDYVYASVEMSGTGIAGWAANERTVQASVELAQRLMEMNDKQAKKEAIPFDSNNDWWTDMDREKSERIKQRLKALPVERIMEFVRQMPSCWPNLDLLVWAPRLDGEFLPRDFTVLLNNLSTTKPPKPALIGVTENEAIYFAIQGKDTFVNPFGLSAQLIEDGGYGPEEFRQFVRQYISLGKICGDEKILDQMVEDICRFYYADDGIMPTPKCAKDNDGDFTKINNNSKTTSLFFLRQYTRFISDVLFNVPMLVMAAKRVEHGWPTHLYLNRHFNPAQFAPQPIAIGGAATHGNEYPYMNGLFPVGTFEFNERDRAHQRVLIRMLSDFVKNGVPPKLCRKNGVKLGVANSIAEVKLKAEFFIVDADDDMNGGSNDSAASSNCAVVEQMCQSWRFWMDFCQTHDFNASLFTGIPR